MKPPRWLHVNAAAPGGPCTLSRASIGLYDTLLHVSNSLLNDTLLHVFNSLHNDTLFRVFNSLHNDTLLRVSNGLL